MVHSIIQQKARATPDFFFIQIGGKDGKTFDPIYKYVIRYNWHGVVVEPSKFWFRKLSETYKNHSSIQLENSAIAEENGEKIFYQVKPKNWYLRFIGGSLSSLSRNTILKHKWRPGLESNIVTEKVPCLSFQSLLEKYIVKKIDLLVIDAEGYDYTILKHINFSYIRPSMIFYEHKHMSRDEQNQCHTLLRAQGYSLERQGRNTFAYSFTSISP